MATFLSSALAIAALLQAPAPADSLDALRARVAADSDDAKAWFALGQGLVRLSSDYHAHRMTGDTAWARAILDTADAAFTKAATLYPGTAAADSARVFRVFTWADRALLAWELGGVEAAARTWTTLPADLKLPPVLEGLGENLLRACPREGVLIAGTDADASAAPALDVYRRAAGLAPALCDALATFQLKGEVGCRR